MFRSSYRILTVWGIPIKIHISLIVLLVIFGLPMLFRGGAVGLALLLYLEVAIFTSIALHELGHSFVAIRKGCRVREITLMFIGGAAQMEEIPKKPGDEFQMAVAGPAVSIAIGLVCWFLGGLVPLQKWLWPLPFVSKEIPCNLLQLPGLINFGLAFFNLLPSFPMDGGRVLRAALTPRMGRLRATFVASRIGKVMAVGFGLYAFLFEGSLFLIFIAFFIYTIAEREYRAVQIQEAMGRQGFGGWPSDPFQRPPDDDTAVIGPPPYRKSQGDKAQVRQTGGSNPFKRFFGKQ